MLAAAQQENQALFVAGLEAAKELINRTECQSNSWDVCCRCTIQAIDARIATEQAKP